ncbi:phospholipase/carboxylesterase [Hyphomonas polymorpha PS728]|uniref:Phospholipase/carboxylesterase n=1 Tax=Hyphomonas polymorpha PS728 TaxID=1280954 RepID=A0A062VB44_9PROT|nr:MULTISPECIES: PHB depolymerase family esterase [Hyphomonas]AXE65734.1 hypothetical protein BBF93_16975 [Hyphomonas sp. CACIAM 19H1]KCZ97436.1 phospholipase/carboxylesterase [Hyphomonas polymorpha PS728]
MRPLIATLILSCILLGGVAAAAPGPSPKAETLSVKAGKDQREFILYTPQDTRRGMPVVLVFHGGGGGAEWMASKSRKLARTFTEAGYAVVYMNGSSRRDGEKLRTWNAAHCCAYAQRQNIDEATYINAAVDALDRKIGIDRTRIFLVGHSNGAMLSYRVAGQMKDAPRAIAPISGAIFADQPALPARTSIFMYHAKDDEVLSYSGNPDDKAERWRTQPHLGFEKAEVELARLKGCGAPGIASPAPGLTEIRRACAGGSTLLALSAETGGHEWASRAAASYQIEDTLLTFFNSQR